MKCSWRIGRGGWLLITVLWLGLAHGHAAEPENIRVGIIGLDTSHAVNFTKILNDPNAEEDVADATDDAKRQKAQETLDQLKQLQSAL